MAITDTYQSVLSRRNPRVTTVRSLLRRYADYRSKRRSLAELRGLDGRTLKNLAIDRSELSSVVYGDPHGRKRAWR